MAKEIKITLYTPKELWAKFCNWVFWPRRKKCSVWCYHYYGCLHREVVDILQKACDEKKISDEVAEELELAIDNISMNIADSTAKLMSEPFE